jgi:hypothetical protein
MMFSESSCSPAEIHILLPVRRNVSPAEGTALVATSASDEPACGSDRHEAEEPAFDHGYYEGLDLLLGSCAIRRFVAAVRNG